jgi:arginine-tRNA-protein transferase
VGHPTQDNQISSEVRSSSVCLVRTSSVKIHRPKDHLKNPEFDVSTATHCAEYGVLKSTPDSESLSPAHKFTLELDEDTFTEEKYALYLKYQQTIHKESKSSNTPEQFGRFLCCSPLHGATYHDPTTGAHRRVGSFHQLYRLDGRLVAFGVLDLLPHTISSVYFVYDPEALGKFGMGKVSAVREVAMCIELGHKYYGLGNQIYGRG